jgi:hypothetical protein
MSITSQSLALDELYWSWLGEGDLIVFHVGIMALWASMSPIALDGESWKRLVWQLEEQGMH